MGFSYHKPTRTYCPVCEEFKKDNSIIPIISSNKGRASASNGYPFHNWYNFVLGYTPTFPEYILKREHITTDDVILDPFVGSGTTQIVCKLNKIPSYGIDANDFMVFAAEQKLNWFLDPHKLKEILNKLSSKYLECEKKIDWDNDNLIFEKANENRPASLDKRYISDKPLVKIKLLKSLVKKMNLSKDYLNFFMFALSSILVPASNIKYGPGFGVGKRKDDVDVLSLLKDKINEIIKDLSTITEEQKNTKSTTILGDSRHLTEYIKPNSISYIITSPPYPGDHEYTKHSKLELIFNEYATDISSFRTIKKRMIRGSTTNIYKADNEKIFVKDYNSIKVISNEIDLRIKEDGGTSGFEKLYSKLVWEYFGGMFNTLTECWKVLKPGGKIILLVSDSHAFKMVHIQTAEILKEIGEKIGFINPEIILWQLKNSTSHNYQIRENILILQKPFTSTFN